MTHWWASVSNKNPFWVTTPELQNVWIIVTFSCSSRCCLGLRNADLVSPFLEQNVTVWIRYALPFVFLTMLLSHSTPKPLSLLDNGNHVSTCLSLLYHLIFSVWYVHFVFVCTVGRAMTKQCLSRGYQDYFTLKGVSSKLYLLLVIIMTHSCAFFAVFQGVSVFKTGNSKIKKCMQTLWITQTKTIL